MLAQPAAPDGAVAAAVAGHDPGFRPDPAGLVPHGLTDRAHRNLAALDTLTAVAAGAGCGDADREVLARWTGWGALPQLFDPTADRFGAERDELRARLTPAEWRAASASTLNAHYTDPAVIAAVWNLVCAAGFDGGRVLEPGCGSGLFIGLAPCDVRASSRFVGVELEPVTARIAQALYPEAEIRPVGFETVRDPDGSFDIAVGNVPFGKYRLHDPLFNRERLTIANYFTLKALRLVKPGGLVCVVTSRFTMDARNPAGRRALYEYGDLLAAIRLPNGAHEQLAGTRVVTDALLFRRAQPGRARRPFDWETTTVVDLDGVDARINDCYLPDGPGDVVGALTTGRGVYGDDEVMVTTPPAGLPVALADTVSGLAGRVADTYHPAPATPATAAPVKVEGHDLAVGELAVTATGMLAEHTPNGPVRVSGVTRPMTARIVELVRLRDQARTVIALQRRPPDPDVLRAWDDARLALGRLYDAYVARWGPINAFQTTDGGGRRYLTPARFRRDPGWGLVSALEVFDPDTHTAVKAAIFTQWLATPERRFTGAEDPAAALATSLGAGRGVDVAFIAELLACHPDVALAELAGAGLVYRSHDDPDRWEPAAAYLSGDVRARLAAARLRAAADDRYLPNVAALERVLPDWLPAEAISARLGAVWIPASDVHRFLVDTLGADDRVRVEHVPIVGRWVVTVPSYLAGSVAATEQWGTREVSAYDLVQDALNLSPTIVYRTAPDGARIKLEAETLAANDKRTALCEEFSTWVWTDPERAARLEQVYNDRFNSTVLPTWDGSHLDHLPGLSAGFSPHPHQLDAVWRIMGSAGNVLLGHRVGAGKTAAMVIAGQQLRRTGQITKPLYVVPNHMLDQFAAEMTQLYPMANVLVASRDDLSEQARRAFVARCATGAWDAVVMTHSTFGRIPVEPATERAHVEAELERFTAAAHAARAVGASAAAVKQIEKAAAAWNTRLAELLDAPADLGNVSFESLGVDYVFVDEAHAFKGLPFVTSLPLPRSQSKRATDMVMKLDWLRTRYGAKVATFATGTPIANSLAEMWVLQRFLTPDALRAQEMEAFDSWAGTFARPVTRMELAPEGGRFRLHTRIAAFDNVPELLTQFRSFTDLLGASDVPALAVPDLVGGRAETVVVEPTDELDDVIASFAERADRIRSRLVDPAEDNMLVVCNDGRLASLDLRLVGRPQPAGTGKLPAVADRIAELWAAHRDRRYRDTAGQPSPAPGALQLVFCDKGTPSGDRFNAYHELARLLVERGMDPARIRFIHDAGTDHAKARLFAACRHGQVDVLVGSTEKMGTGVNVQARLIAPHHVDVPWRPADIEQREGRILRQGNQNPAVHIVRYVTTGSFDPYMWGTVERKARFIAQITAPVDAADSVRSVEDLDSEVVLSYAEIKAVATGNPLIREHAEVGAEVARLTRLATNHARAQRALPGRLRSLEDRIERLTAAATWLSGADAARVDTRGDRFAYTTPDGDRLEDRRDAGTWLRDTLARLPISDDTWTPVGTMGGVDWEATRQRRYPTTTCEVRVVGDHDGVSWGTTDLYDSAPHTIMTRLERHLDKFGDRLTTVVRDRQTSSDQLQRGRHTLGQPFPHADRLAELSSRYTQLETSLAAIDNPPPVPPPAPPSTGLTL